MQIETLINDAMNAAKITSHRQLGEHLGISHTIIGQWAKGERHPTFEAAATLAAMAGLPPAKTAAEIRLHTPEGAKHRGILRRIAAAAGILLAVYTAGTPSATNADEIGHKGDTVGIAHLLRSLARKLLAILGLSGDTRHGQAALY